MPPPDGSTYTGQGDRRSFYDVLTAAVSDFTANGYDSIERLAYWVREIREAAIRSMVSPHVLEESLGRTFRGIYRSKIDRGGILAQHEGIPRFTLERVAPRLRRELDRRILASADLIKLNRQAAIEKTVQRFSGWASSISPGGSDAVNKIEVKSDIRKSLGALPFEERRVNVDQSHKFVANLSNILGTDGGAIALRWRSHFRQPGYNFREDHKERDEKIYLLRGNWAQEKGLVKPGPAGYYDEITAVGEEVFCRCYAVYLHSLRLLPADMLTAKGREELARIKMALAA